MGAPSVRVSCSLLILQLIKPNIPDGVSTGLLGAEPLPHCPGVDRQEGQVGGGDTFSPIGTQGHPQWHMLGLHCDPRDGSLPLCSAPLDPLKERQIYSQGPLALTVANRQCDLSWWLETQGLHGPRASHALCQGHPSLILSSSCSSVPATSPLSEATPPEIFTRSVPAEDP